MIWYTILLYEMCVKLVFPLNSVNYTLYGDSMLKKEV